MQIPLSGGVIFGMRDHRAYAGDVRGLQGISEINDVYL
jgi:hypothetical protein